MGLAFVDSGRLAMALGVTRLRVNRVAIVVAVVSSVV